MRKYLAVIIGLIVSFVLTMSVIVPLERWTYISLDTQQSRDYIFLAFGVLEALVLGFLAIGLFSYSKTSIIGIVTYLGYISAILVMRPIVYSNQLLILVLYVFAGATLTFSLESKSWKPYFALVINALLILIWNSILVLPTFKILT